LKTIDFAGFVFDAERAELYTAKGVRVALRPRSLAVLHAWRVTLAIL
jgi:hypothetical protein